MAAVAVRLVAKASGVDFISLSPQSRFIEDLRMDDLELPELYMYLDEELPFEISDEDAISITTLGSLVLYLHARSQSHAA